MRNVFLAVVLSASGACSTVPSGTRIELRLLTALNSAGAKPGQSFEAVVIAPVAVEAAIVVQPDARVIGHVKEVTLSQSTSEQTALLLTFNEIRAGAQRVLLSAKLVEVENARETVDSDGRLVGIKVSDTGSGRLDQGINKLSQKYSGLGELLGAVKQSVVKEADPAINYPAGVELKIEVSKPFVWVAREPAQEIAAIHPESSLASLVLSQPVVTYAVKPPKPSDIPNVMLLGTEEQITAAFEAAGWTKAGQLNRKSKFETFKALAEDRGYQEAPVSTILLDGRPTDLVFEKANDTFAARHHLRVWRRAAVFNGRTVWLCAATHDTGIGFSEANRTFIHKIDPHIDDERAKVVNDLMFTGLVKGLALVDRPDTPTSGHNATGDAFQTDGRMAVVQF
jgi:hypothetical protein